jgi:hypothetical protein
MSQKIFLKDRTWEISLMKYPVQADPPTRSITLVADASSRSASLSPKSAFERPRTAGAVSRPR